MSCCRDRSRIEEEVIPWKSRCGAWLGYAKEYVKSVWLLHQQEQPSSYFVAMGVDATAKDFTEASFVRIELD